MLGKGLRIGLVGPLPPPSGGMATQTLQLARLLENERVDVEIVQVNPPYRPDWVANLRWIRAPFRLLPYTFRLWRTAGHVHLLHVMANSGWSWHLSAAPAIWIAWCRGKPVIVNYRGGEAEAFLQKHYRWLRPTLGKVSIIVVPSGFLHDIFAKWNVTTQIVPNVVDLSRFRAKRGTCNYVHLVVARNLEYIYDIATAIRAFRNIHTRHPDARLTIAGSGPCRASLERLCVDLALDDAVTFTGRLESDQMAALYRNATILLNPSLADNMPNSLLEAMASGVPIVSTNVGGIRYLVEHEKSALLVPPGDPAAMSAAALRVIEDPCLAELLRTSALDAVKSYAWARVRAGLFAVYTSALDRTDPVRRQPSVPGDTT